MLSNSSAAPPAAAPHASTTDPSTGTVFQQTTIPTSDVKNVYKRAHQLTKIFILQSHAMPDKCNNTFLPLLISAATDVTRDQVLAWAWAHANKQEGIRKMAEAATYIRTIFKDFAAHCVQDAYQLREAAGAAANHGLSETQHVLLTQVLAL
ncbi:hypothetical protein BDN67DRAFT_1013985 [Paxillus ammoniavirescens]|nr:hypothetical protein BDN67DRAFT_1013985 [Paxillus ammoniavirescens]